MSIDGYANYERRAYYKAVRCPVQLRLDDLEGSSEAYQRVRETCVRPHDL